MINSSSLNAVVHNIPPSSFCPTTAPTALGVNNWLPHPHTDCNTSLHAPPQSATSSLLTELPLHMACFFMAGTNKPIPCHLFSPTKASLSGLVEAFCAESPKQVDASVGQTCWYHGYTLLTNELSLCLLTRPLNRLMRTRSPSPRSLRQV